MANPPSLADTISALELTRTTGQAALRQAEVFAQPFLPLDGRALLDAIPLWGTLCIALEAAFGPLGTPPRDVARGLVGTYTVVDALQGVRADTVPELRGVIRWQMSLANAITLLGVEGLPKEEDKVEIGLLEAAAPASPQATDGATDKAQVEPSRASSRLARSPGPFPDRQLPKQEEASAKRGRSDAPEKPESPKKKRKQLAESFSVEIHVPKVKPKAKPIPKNPRPTAGALFAKPAGWYATLSLPPDRAVVDIINLPFRRQWKWKKDILEPAGLTDETKPKGEVPGNFVKPLGPGVLYLSSGHLHPDTYGAPIFLFDGESHHNEIKAELVDGSISVFVRSRPGEWPYMGNYKPEWTGRTKPGELLSLVKENAKGRKMWASKAWTELWRKRINAGTKQVKEDGVVSIVDKEPWGSLEQEGFQVNKGTTPADLAAQVTKDTTISFMVLRCVGHAPRAELEAWDAQRTYNNTFIH